MLHILSACVSQPFRWPGRGFSYTHNGRNPRRPCMGPSRIDNVHHNTGTLRQFFWTPTKLGLCSWTGFNQHLRQLSHVQPQRRNVHLCNLYGVPNAKNIILEIVIPPPRASIEQKILCRMKSPYRQRISSGNRHSSRQAHNFLKDTSRTFASGQQRSHATQKLFFGCPCCIIALYHFPNLQHRVFSPPQPRACNKIIQLTATAIHAFFHAFFD